MAGVACGGGFAVLSSGAMRLHPPTGRIEVFPGDLAEVNALYDAGQYVKAFHRAEAVGPLRDWLGAEAQVLAGRRAGNLFAGRLSRFMHLRAWREHREDPGAAYFRALELLQARGPLLAWKFLQRLPEFPQATSEQQSDLLSARVDVLVLFRDFNRAEETLREAEAMEQARLPWLACVRCSLLQASDRYEEALGAVDRALELQAWYRPAVQRRAELLQLTERDEEAAALLVAALEHLESPAVAAQLALLQAELGRPQEARATLERFRGLAPIIDAQTEQWWHGRMSDVCYDCGDLALAAEHATKAGTPFFKRLAERLAAPGAERRPVRWTVPFVRQHHVTCAPATISALSRYLGSPIDHLELAQVICYDGTPAHVERHWLEEHGWVVREFRVTAEIAKALLDRGLPFALATVETQSAHLQAVVGYDGLRGTLYIRDPYERTHSEAFAEEFLERYRSNGPRGSVFVRPEEAHRLEGLSLPEGELYDCYYAVERALHLHDRPEAERKSAELERLAPGSRLALEAGRLIAGYDNHRGRQLAATEALLALYPEDGNLLLAQTALLRETASREELAQRIAALANREKTHPIFWCQWADELMNDSRRHAEAHWQILRALRYQPTNPENLNSLGNLLWTRQEFARAAELFRLCTCLGDKREDYARTYLFASRHLRAVDAPLELFRQRFERFGARSAQPARVLFAALTTLDRPPEAFAALEEALRLRPDDGELLRFAADAFARYGETERAAALLAAAEPRSPRAQWLRTAANLADIRCDLTEALALWRQILPEEPLAMDAQTVVTRLLAEVEGTAAARAHLREACARFPHYVPLWTLAVEWARSEGAAATEALVREMLAADANNAWARRELALALSGQRRFEEAEKELALAREIEANAIANFTVGAQLALAARRLPEAREAARAAIRLSIDQTGAMQQLLEACESFAEKREAIGFLREELIRQVVLGEGLLTYRELAFPILEPEELLAGLQEAHAARPDLWHAWVALTLQLTDLRLLEEALTTAQRATELFPLHAQPWLQLALVHRARAEHREEIRPLTRGLILLPAWGRLSRELSATHERLGDFAQAEQVLERAIAAAPLDAANHYALANLRWSRGKKKEALANVEHALKLQPGYEDAWSSLGEWSKETGQPARAAELARELTQVRAGEARSWYILALMLPAEPLAERLEALDRALALSPFYEEAHDVKAQMLAQAGRFDEALAACAPAAWTAETLPFVLRGRAAWIEARRGNVRTAIAQMVKVVEGTPDYYWGWNRLVEWYANTGQLEQAREATRRMARLVPHSAVPLGYIADLQERLDDKKAALATLRQALAVDPAYPFAAFTIFRLEMEERKFEAAGRTLAHIRLHLPGPEADACGIELDSRTKRSDESLVLFRKLCFVPEAHSFALNRAAEALIHARLGSSLEAICRECLTRPEANPEVGHWWVERFTSRHAWGERKVLYGLDPAKPAAGGAYRTLLQTAGRQMKHSVVREMVRRQGAALRAIPELWGTVGFAYLELERPEEVVRWLHDWRTKEGAEPWMLSNLAVALRQLNRKESFAEAAEVNRRALELRADRTTPQHQLWVAYDEAIVGHPGNAERLVAETAGVQLTQVHEAVRTLVQAMVRVQTAPAGERAKAFARERRVLRAPEHRPYLFAKGFRAPLQRAYVAMAKAAGVRYNPVWTWGGPGRGGKRWGNIEINPWHLICIAIVVSVGTLARLASLPESSRVTPEPYLAPTRSAMPHFTPRPRPAAAPSTPSATPPPLPPIQFQQPGTNRQFHFLPPPQFPPIATPRRTN